MCKRFSTELSFKNTVSAPFGGKDTANGIRTHCSCTLSTALPVPVAKMPTIFENVFLCASSYNSVHVTDHVILPVYMGVKLGLSH
jgi:hypothetical protein